MSQIMCWNYNYYIKSVQNKKDFRFSNLHITTFKFEKSNHPLFLTLILLVITRLGYDRLQSIINPTFYGGGSHYDHMLGF